MLYFSDSLTQLYLGSSLHMREIADNSVHCVCCSPPYWGQRKYKGAQELVWGGDGGCEHEWARERRKGQTGYGGHFITGGQPKLADGDIETCFCQKCGAWHGAYGLEPTPEMWIEHTLMFLREIRRVLRLDGICWLNVDDKRMGGQSGPNLRLQIESEELEAATQCDPGDAWASGFFDGEGTVAIVKNSGHPAGKLRITAIQVERAPIERLQRLFGGSIRQVVSKHENWRSCWIWELSSQRAVAALKRMEPFLLVKKRQAELAYAFQATMGTNNGKPRLTVEVLAERERIKRAISECSHTTIEEPPKSLDLCLIPQRLAIAAQADGWFVRSVVMWTKPNPMPESVSGWTFSRHRVKVKPSARGKPGSYHAEAQPDKPQGARDGREFADHENEYVDCPGCPKCLPNDGLVLRKGSWRPTCKCGREDVVPATILDPFCGTGTTLWVAKKLGRRAIGYDLSEEYCQMALERTRQGGLL